MLHKTRARNARPYGYSDTMCACFFPQHCRGAHRVKSNMVYTLCKHIAVRESHLPGQITLIFRQFRIGRIDLERRVYTMKRSYRLVDDPRENM